MRKILIASHGHFASGMKSSLDVLLGNSTHVHVIDAYVDEKNVEEEIICYLDSINCDDQVIMLSDLMGGSVHQMMTLCLNREKTYLVSGINLALVLELAVSQEEITIEELKQLVEMSKQMYQVITLEQFQEEDNKEDFF